MIGLNGCDKYLEMMSSFMDGELDEGLRAELSEHISTCKDCFNASLAYKAINEAISDGQEEPPEDLCALVMAKVRTEGAPSKAASPAARKHSFRRLGILAAALVVLAVTVVAAPSMFKGKDNAVEDVAEVRDTAKDGDAKSGEGSQADGKDPEHAAPGSMLLASSSPLGSGKDSSFLPIADDDGADAAPGALTAAPPEAADAPAADAPAAAEEETADDSAPAPDAEAAHEEHKWANSPPVEINGYSCSAIIVLDPAITPPDVFDQYTYYSWQESQEEYHIVSSDLYDELMESIENLGYAYTLDIFGQQGGGEWILLITAVKE